VSDTPDPSDVLRRYFSALQDCRFDEAVDCFTADVFYSHPALPEDGPGAPRREARGRAQLRQFFEARGRRKGRQRVERWATGADRTFVSGLVFNPTGEVAASFVSELMLAEDGRISWYAAYSSRPPVGTTILQHEGASR
jgi:ketosteroid isomerase-like protein